MPVNNFLVTHSGIRFDLLDPEVDQVQLSDILFSLGHLNRYTGHVGTYSVLEHTIHVAHCARELVEDVVPFDRRLSSDTILEALIHDMAEAYTGDISSPMKKLLRPVFSAIEERINDVIREKFDFHPIPGWEYKIMQKADEMVTHAEALHFLGKDQADWATKPWPRFHPFGHYDDQGKPVSAFDYEKSVFMHLWEDCRS